LQNGTRSSVLLATDCDVGIFTPTPEKQPSSTTGICWARTEDLFRYYPPDDSRVQSESIVEILQHEKKS
jgi:hypothetical protein